MIRVVVAEPRRSAVVKMISDTLEGMQAEVGGSLELFWFSNLALPYAIHCYIHEEGKFDSSLERNAAAIGWLGSWQTRFAYNGDWIVGNIVASKAGAVSGKEIGLTEVEAEFARGYLDHIRGLCDETCDAKKDHARE